MTSNMIAAIESAAYADEQIADAHKWLDNALTWKARGDERVCRERMDWVEGCIKLAVTWSRLANQLHPTDRRAA